MHSALFRFVYRHDEMLEDSRNVVILRDKSIAKDEDLRYVLDKMALEPENSPFASLISFQSSSLESSITWHDTGTLDLLKQDLEREVLVIEKEAAEERIEQRFQWIEKFQEEAEVKNEKYRALLAIDNGFTDNDKRKESISNREDFEALKKGHEHLKKRLRERASDFEVSDLDWQNQRFKRAQSLMKYATTDYYIYRYWEMTKPRFLEEFRFLGRCQRETKALEEAILQHGFNKEDFLHCLMRKPQYASSLLSGIGASCDRIYLIISSNFETCKRCRWKVEEIVQIMTQLVNPLSKPDIVCKAVYLANGESTDVDDAPWAGDSGTMSSCCSSVTSCACGELFHYLEIAEVCSKEEIILRYFESFQPAPTSVCLKIVGRVSSVPDAEFGPKIPTRCLATITASVAKTPETVSRSPAALLAPATTAPMTAAGLGAKLLPAHQTYRLSLVHADPQRDTLQGLVIGGVKLGLPRQGPPTKTPANPVLGRQGRCRPDSGLMAARVLAWTGPPKLR